MFRKVSNKKYTVNDVATEITSETNIGAAFMSPIKINKNSIVDE